MLGGFSFRAAEKVLVHLVGSQVEEAVPAREHVEGGVVPSADISGDGNAVRHGGVHDHPVPPVNALVRQHQVAEAVVLVNVDT